jgi:hypothetical protein
MEQSRCPIILVHGTWGRGVFPKRQDEGSCDDSASQKGARWFEKGSRFRTTLETQLNTLSVDYSLRSFCWSGANSVFERDRAATKLAAELKADLQDPSAAPIIITHSHGGNVTLRALRHLDDASRIKLVTLATPFLRVFVRDTFHVPPFVLYLAWAAITGIAFGLGLLAVFATGLAGGSGQSSSSWVFIGTGIAAALGSAFIVFRLPSVVADRSRARQIEEAASYPAIGLSGPSMLVIRGVDDEAALSLAAGSIGSRLSSQFLFVLPTVISVGVFVFALLGWFGLRTDSPVLVLTAGGASATLLLLFLPGICKSAFGREFLTTGLVCEIAADSVPDACRRIDAETLSPIASTPGRLLRHGLYDHPECVNRIVRWIRAVG